MFAGEDPDVVIQNTSLQMSSLYAYDAVWAVALSLANAEKNVPDWLQGRCNVNNSAVAGDINCHGDDLTALIRGSDFSGASGTVKFKMTVGCFRLCAP
jgi:hypothetical protein